MKLYLALLVVLHLCTSGMTEVFDAEMDDEIRTEVRDIAEEYLDSLFAPHDALMIENEAMEDEMVANDMVADEMAEDDMVEDDIVEDDWMRGPFHDDICKYGAFESGHEVKLNPSAQVVQNAFATTDFSAGEAIVWDNAIIPMLGKVYKLHHVLADRVALIPPGGGHGQDYFYFPFGAFVSGFKVGTQVRLHFDQNVVKNSFNGMTQYVWDDAIIPMLGNKYTIVELRGSMIGVQSPGGDTFYFPVGALVKEECYKDCGAHGRLEDRNCICNQGWSGDLCHIQGSGCVTIGKKPCIFPFKYKGVSYSACTDARNGGKLWCSTKNDGAGNYAKWDNCDVESCSGGSCKYLGFTAGADVKLNPSAQVVKNAFSTTEFKGDPIVWDNAIIPMLGKVYKLHHVLEDRIALIPPGGGHSQQYFFFPFKAFVSEFQPGLKVRLNFDKDTVKNSFNGLTNYVWDDAIIPMLGNQYVVKEVRGAMIGIEAPGGGQLFYFPIGALVPEHCYKECKHGILDTGKCKCNAGWTGDLCDQRVCKPACKNGECMNGKCLCNGGWGGKDCGKKLCQPKCKRGKCNNGKCKCPAGWGGNDCGSKLCKPTCVHGTCNNGVCKCDAGYGGKSCNEKLCNPSCINGKCDNGVCKCNAGWTGAACGEKLCNPTCVHGTCNNGVCKCDAGYNGKACDKRVCNPSCIRGTCDDGVCRCPAGYTGERCGQKLCNPTCEHGTCNNGVCKCDAGYTGKSCNEKLCNPSCVRGTCDNGVCRCPAGWTGVRCDKEICNPSCEHGTCVNGKCKCDNGWTGARCNERVCNPACVHGKCNNGVCVCFDGYTGATCNEKLCRPACVHGTCNNGVCKCDAGWTGRSCNERLCNPKCIHGVCNNGVCKCQSGWTGANCGTKVCIPACVRGSCVNGKCQCPAGWGGHDCNTKLCNPSCVRGTCTNGACVCPAGWGGADCNTKLCNPKCVNGKCNNGKCVCNAGWGGASCNEKLCNPSCVRGACTNGACVCPAGWGGADCNTKLCNPKCVNGKCTNGKCVCNAGWTGPSCGAEACNPSCVHGKCVGGKCQCNAGYEGADCNTKVCNPKCVNGKCTDGKCVCNKGWEGAACDKESCVDTLDEKKCHSLKSYCGQIKTGGSYAKYMKAHCCAYCANAPCKNGGDQTEAQCIKRIDQCDPMSPWMDTNCCETCRKYSDKCLDTGRINCKDPKYTSTLRQIKDKKYKGSEKDKHYYEVHCCDRLKNLPAAACKDKHARCSWTKWLTNNKKCLEQTWKTYCCAACKKILAGK